MDSYFDLAAPDSAARPPQNACQMPEGWSSFIPASKKGWQVLQSQDTGSSVSEGGQLAFDRQHTWFEHLGGNPFTINCWVANGNAQTQVTDVSIFMSAYNLDHATPELIPLFAQMIWNSYGWLPDTTHQVIDVPSTRPLTYPGPISHVPTAGSGNAQQQRNFAQLNCFSLAVFQFPEVLPRKFAVDVSVFLNLNGRRFGNDPELDVDMGGDGGN